MKKEFDGIREKLKRADENIFNLKSEIDAFIQNGKHPTIPHPNDKMWQEAVNYHRDKPIPLRFSVLAGEIIHQLRSILDHVVWLFSDDSARINHSGAIEFRIFEHRPRDKDELRRYERKIQGISNVRVRKFIGALQPYRTGSNAASQPIFIIHDMDRFDKHRELVIVDTSVNMVFTFPSPMKGLRRIILKHQQGEPLTLEERAMMGRAIKQYGQVAPDVAFRQFGQRGSQPVVPALTQLADHVRVLVDRFEAMYR